MFPPLTVTADPSGLAPGTYLGEITVTPALGSALTIPVTLTVISGAPARVTASPSSLSFNWPYGAAAPATQTIAVASTGGAAPFTAYPNYAFSFGSWLQVDPVERHGARHADCLGGPHGLSTAGGYRDRSFHRGIVINGPDDAITIPVQFTISGLAVSPSSLAFAGHTGTAAQTQAVFMTPSISVADE